MSGRSARAGLRKRSKSRSWADRIDGGDAGAVGDQRIGHAAARADRDAGLAGKADDVGHDQEQRRIAVLGDGGQLGLQPLLPLLPTGGW